MRPVKEGVVPAPASTPGPEHDNALRPPTRRLFGIYEAPMPHSVPSQPRVRPIASTARKLRSGHGTALILTPLQRDTSSRAPTRLNLVRWDETTATIGLFRWQPSAGTAG